MSVSIYQLGYKKLSQIIFEWQAADRASLLALFMSIEVLLHWLWCLYVWWRQDALVEYVNIAYIYPLWIVTTIMGLFFLWMVGKLSRIKNNRNDLNKWQIILLIPYTFYIASVIILMSYSSLFAGVSLVGGAMLGMMLVRRRYIWRVFLLQIFLILIAIVMPYFGIRLPSLRYLTVIHPLLDTYSYLTYNEIMAVENAMAAASLANNKIFSWDNISDLQRSSAFFWRLTHVYLAIPKAIFIVYAFRTLLLILDESKKEIVQHANQDELTQLNNRRFGLTEMQKTLIETTESQDNSIILLDLDLFKTVNDNYGHEVGDQVLCEVAKILTESLSDNAIVSRYGGEEFLIILPDTTHDEAIEVAEQLRVYIARHIIKVTEDFSFNITASLGLYTLDDIEMRRIKNESLPIALIETTSKLGRLRRFKSLAKEQKKVEPIDTQLYKNMSQRLIRIADKALYKAKDRGRDQVVSANELIASGDFDVVILESRCDR